MTPDASDARLAATYDALWATSRPALAAGRVEPEPLPVEPTVRWGISAVLRPRPWPRALTACATDCASLLGAHGVVYGARNFHITLRAIDGYRDDVAFDDADVRAYRHVLAAVARRTPPIRVRLRGLTATSAGVLVQGWPDEDLQIVRHALYTGLAELGLASRGPETTPATFRTTAHATLALFEGPLVDPARLVDLIDAHRTTDFGEWIFPELWLVGYRRTPGHVSLIEYGRFGFAANVTQPEVAR